MFEIVDGNEVGTWDALITIYSGYTDNAKIKRFFAYAEDEKFITLEDCRKMIGSPKEPVTVIIEQPLHGEVYNYGNHGEYWAQIGTVLGYA